MAPDDVVGTWALGGYELHAANGPITRPFSPHPRGYLLDAPGAPVTRRRGRF